MTPAETAASIDPEVLRDVLYRHTVSMAPDTERKRIVQSGNTEELIALTHQLNQRLPKGCQIKHGLVNGSIDI
jgi:hypothetical protein